MLKVNKTLTMVDLSDNEIGAEVTERWYDGTVKSTKPTPEGPASLADGLKANLSVQQLDVSANGLGVDGGKAIAASIAENSTITSVSYQQNTFLSIFLTCLSLPLVSAFSIHWVSSSMLNRMVSEPPALKLLERC